MAIPVIAIPDQGRILARPRWEPVYDSEGFQDGAAIGAATNPNTLTIYKDSTAFANTALGLSKQKNRDTNLDAPTGLSVGQSFQWYALALAFEGMNQSEATIAAAYYDQLRQLREQGWVTFFFTGRQPYFTVQAWQVPNTHASQAPVFSTLNNINSVGVACEQSLENVYDVTLGGEPVEFGQLEAWTLDYVTTSTITPTIDIYVRPQMRGIFLRGIQG